MHRVRTPSLAKLKAGREKKIRLHEASRVVNIKLQFVIVCSSSYSWIFPDRWTVQSLSPASLLPKCVICCTVLYRCSSLQYIDLESEIDLRDGETILSAAGLILSPNCNICLESKFSKFVIACGGVLPVASLQYCGRPDWEAGREAGVRVSDSLLCSAVQVLRLHLVY